MLHRASGDVPNHRDLHVPPLLAVYLHWPGDAPQERLCVRICSPRILARHKHPAWRRLLMRGVPASRTEVRGSVGAARLLSYIG